MRSRRRKKMSRATVFGVILVAIVLCGTMLYKQNAIKAEGKEYAAQIKELQKESKALKKEKEDLKDFKDYVETDEYVEEIAREKFGLVYKGEIIFKSDEKE